MPKWIVEFTQSDLFTVEVEARTIAEAEAAAWSLIKAEPDDYFVETEGLRCNEIYEAKDDPYEVN